MILEFMGIPGAGKTTLHGKVEKNLREAGYSVGLTGGLGSINTSILGKFDRLSSYLAATWRWRKVLRTSACIITRSDRSAGDKIDAIRRLVVSLQHYEAARRSEDDVVLMDEGFAQRCFMILVDGPSGLKLDDVTRLMEEGPHSDILIQVVVEPQTALQRLSSRHRGLPARLIDFAPSDQLEALKSGCELFDQIRWLVTERTMRVTTVISVEPENFAAAADTVVDVVIGTGRHGDIKRNKCSV